MEVTKTWELRIERNVQQEAYSMFPLELEPLAESACEVQTSIMELSRPLTDSEWLYITEWAQNMYIWGTEEGPGTPTKITFTEYTTKQYQVFKIQRTSETVLRTWHL